MLIVVCKMLVIMNHSLLGANDYMLDVVDSSVDVVH